MTFQGGARSLLGVWAMPQGLHAVSADECVLRWDRGWPRLALWLLVSGWLHFTHLENTEHIQKLH